MKKKHQFLLFFGVLYLTSNWAQRSTSLSLIDAYEFAIAQYPLLENQPLLQQASDLRLENIEQSKLPTIQWKADATLQSEVVQFPGDGMVPINIDLPLYNLKTYAEAQYLLFDGGLHDARQEIENLQLLAEQQSLEVDVYSLRAQVNRYFFGVLLLREQSKLIDVTLKDLEEKKTNLQAGVRHGVVLESEVDKISVRQLEIQAEQEQLQQDIRAYLSVLEELTGTSLTEEVKLNLPVLDNFRLNQSLNRPEQQLFLLKKQALLANDQLIEANQKPKLNAFAKAGFGYPNPLNFFDNSVSPYAIGGLAFSWNLFDWGKEGRDRELLIVQSQIIDNQKKTFEHNLNLTEGKYREDIAKLENRIARDREIADLQNKILEQLSSQLEHGVITVTDYLTQVNAELRARQQLELHQVQLQQVKIDYLTQRGVL